MNFESLQQTLQDAADNGRELNTTLEVDKFVFVMFVWLEISPMFLTFIGFWRF